MFRLTQILHSAAGFRSNEVQRGPIMGGRMPGYHHKDGSQGSTEACGRLGTNSPGLIKRLPTGHKFFAEIFFCCLCSEDRLQDSSSTAEI